MSVDFNVVTNHREHTYRSASCFASLDHFPDNMRWKSKWVDDERVKAIKFIIRNTNPAALTYFEYIFASKWKRYITERSLNGALKKGYITVRANIPIPLMLGLLQILRYSHEKTWIANVFFELKNRYPDISEDILFMIAQVTIIGPGNIIVPNTRGSSAHSHVKDQYLTEEDVIRYCTQFPFKTDLPKYNEAYYLKGVHSYFNLNLNRTTNTKTLYDILLDMRKNADSIPFHKKLGEYLFKLQKQVNDYGK